MAGRWTGAEQDTSGGTPQIWEREKQPNIKSRSGSGPEGGPEGGPATDLGAGDVAGSSEEAGG